MKQTKEQHSFLARKLSKMHPIETKSGFNLFSMKRIAILAILGIFILFISSTGFAQEVVEPKKNKESFRKHLRRTTNEQINLLYSGGALLVRLQTKKASIDGLRERGNFGMADKIEEEQKELNQKIVNGFKSNFDFCKTYFFYSHYSKYVKQGQLDSVVFLDKNLEVDTSISVGNNRFLTAEFGKTKQAPGKYYENYETIKTDGGVTTRNTYYGEPHMGFRALIIKDDQFVQLRKPFPYYVRTLSSFIFIKRRPHKTIARMNKKLHKFFRRSNNR